MKITLPKRTSKAFTIVELLVVVSLIAILSGLILNVVNIKGVRSKSRDAQRAGDVKKIQSALEIYYADNRIYPCPAGGCGACNGGSNYYPVSTIASFTNYLNPIPSDPLGPTGAYCSATAYDYWYCSNNSTYIVSTNMEVASSASSSLCSTVGTGCGSASCYAVKNP